jgi:hypothetical protein
MTLTIEQVQEAEAPHRWDGKTLLPPGTDGWPAKYWDIDPVHGTCIVLGERRRKAIVAAMELAEVDERAQRRIEAREARLAGLRAYREGNSVKNAGSDFDELGSSNEPAVGSNPTGVQTGHERTKSVIEQIVDQANQADGGPAENAPPQERQVLVGKL